MVYSEMIFMWRKTKILLLSSLLFLLIVLLAGSLIAWYYQAEVKELMVREVNRHVRTEIGVSDISFSVLRKFPQASVEFRNVVIKVPAGFEYTGFQQTFTDTLFTAESLFLRFNIKDVIRKKFRVTRILAENGVLNLAVNEREEENFRFWKATEEGEGDFNMDLNDVRITNFRITYINSIKQIFLDSDLKRLDMKGNFNRSSARITGSAKGSSREFRHENLSFTGNHDISVKVAVSKDDNLVDIEMGSIDISGIKLAVHGKYEQGDPGNIEMEFKGDNLDISSAISLLGDEFQNNLKPYRFNGKFSFGAAVSGQYSKTVSPGIKAVISADKGEIIRRNTGMRLSGISLSGSYTNGTRRSPLSSAIILNSFAADFGSGSFIGKGSITNLSNPSVDLDISASILLEELSEFYRPDNIIQMGGRITTSFAARGIIQKQVNLSIEELNKMDLKGNLKIENGLLEISKSRHIASGIDGMLHFGKTLRSENLSFNIGGDHFSISGQIDNGLPWLLGNDQVMSITGNFFSRNLDLDNYINPTSGKEPVPGNSEPLVFPANLELKLDFLIDDLRFRKFFSNKFRGKLSYKPRMMILNEVEFNSMDGIISGNGVIAQKINGDFMVQSQLQMQNLDMQKMFFTFNNFGQTFIHGEHLNGSLKGSLGLISEWTPDLALKRERIIADSKVEITNGELISFEPMLGLARFIHVSELNHVKFSTLRNEIFIRDQVITIPRMDVNSSAFNITGSGTHHFDGQFDYRIRVLLSDVLYGKARSAKPENHKFGIVEDDGLGRTSLHLLVSGRTDDYRVSYDHRTVREVIKENIAGEKDILRNILREEFGWFSSDSLRQPDTNGSGVRPPTGEQQKRFQIIWDEEENP
jgi:hypothetical protein